MALRELIEIVILETEWTIVASKYSVLYSGIIFL